MTLSSRRRQFLSAVAVLALAGACGGSGSTGEGSAGEEFDRPTSAEDIEAGGTLEYALANESDGWDPASSNWTPSGLIVANAIYDTLTRFDEAGEIRPYLARSLTPNDDFTRWRIELRPEVTFHNGEDLDADALVENLTYLQRSPLTGDVFARVTAIEAVGELAVEISLSEPFVNLPVIFSTQVGVVVAPAMIANPDRAREPVGTGPFELDEWVPDAQTTVVRNPDYWQTDAAGKQLPYLDEVQFRPIADAANRANALSADDVDVALVPEFDQQERLGQMPGLRLVTDERSEEDEAFIMLNTARPPFDDARLRTALALGTDRESFNQTMHDGLAEIASGPYRPASRWYQPVDYPGYDPDRARQLIDEVESDLGEVKIALLSGPTPDQLAQSQWIQGSWEELGLTVTLETAEAVSLITQVLSGDYDATAWQQFGSAHPLLETVWWHCDFVTEAPKIALNFARNCNETLSSAMDDARNDPDARNEFGYYATVQQELAEDLPYIWLIHTKRAIVSRTEVHDLLRFTLPGGDPGLAFNNGAHPLHQVWVER